MCISIDPDVIFFAKMNFCSTISGSKLVVLNDRKIDCSLLITHIRGSLNEHVACHITHPRKAIVIVFSAIIGINEEGKTKQKNCDNCRKFSHASSFLLFNSAINMPAHQP
jgi:hypothetical protein